MGRVATDVSELPGDSLFQLHPHEEAFNPLSPDHRTLSRVPQDGDLVHRQGDDAC